MCVGGTGYLYVVLSSPSKKKSYSVHGLMMRTFEGKCPKGKEVLHNNGNKTDCKFVNLRYGTRSENANDKYKHGHKDAIGFLNRNSKLNKQDYTYIKNNRFNLSSRKMGAKLNVSHSVILKAIKQIQGGIV